MSDLGRWLDEVALPGRRIVGRQPLTGGYSNENILLTTADGGRFVLRRYLRRNPCAVEAALAERLAGVVPVPEVVAFDADGAAAGEPVLLSAFAPGRQLGAVLASLSPAGVAEAGGTGATQAAVAASGQSGEAGAAARLGEAAGAMLARLGSVTFDAPGFFSGADLRPGPAGMEPTDGLDVFVRRCLAEGNAAGHLSDAEHRNLLRYADEAAPALAELRGARQLVHSDYNPKNLLAARVDGRWQITAVLDWEFAFSSTPLVDVGNMLRDPRPPGFEEGFLDGFRSGGGDLPPNWRQLSSALDLFALADFLTRPVGHRYFGKAIARIRALPTS